jgi:hypothetical protein
MLRSRKITAHRAQSLYCAISLAKRRNKAIAPYGSGADRLHFSEFVEASFNRCA